MPANISIHALLAESDSPVSVMAWGIFISIHALLAESDIVLLILPIRKPDFYPRSPCGERLWADTDYNLSDIISIHALLAESDHEPPVSSTGATKFLSTLSLRRATALGLLGWLRVLISIHALLAESDGRRFSSRRPFVGFLSTLSLRRATSGVHGFRQ